MPRTGRTDFIKNSNFEPGKYQIQRVKKQNNQLEGKIYLHPREPK